MLMRRIISGPRLGVLQALHLPQVLGASDVLLGDAGDLGLVELVFRC